MIMRESETAQEIAAGIWDNNNKLVEAEGYTNV
jgi:hypothetical protein